MPHSIFDELVFQAGPLGELPPGGEISLQVQVPVGTGAKTFQQALPLFARRPPMPASDINWPAYCGLLKDLAIPLQVPLAAIEQLSVTNVPPRFARRDFDEGFKLDELQTAEAMEVRCIAQTGSVPWARLPLEIGGWHELKQLIETVRELTDASLPIGLGMLSGDVYTDISNALAARVDFVILEANIGSEQLDAAQLGQLAWGVVAARNAAIQSGAPAFPIFVDAPVVRVDHLIKLLALGASAVSIDALASSCLSKSVEQPAATAKGMLSGIGALPLPAKSSPNVEPLARKLKELVDRLRNQVFAQQVNRLSQVNRDHLRALSEQASKLCNVRLLDHTT